MGIYKYLYMINEENCNCYVLRKISSNITALYDNELSSTGLKITQFAILKSLKNLKKSNLKSLALEMNYNRSTLGRNIKKLEKKQFIKITKESDKRELIMSLTKNGSEALKNAQRCWEIINEKINCILGNKKKSLLDLLNNKELNALKKQ